VPQLSLGGFEHEEQGPLLSMGVSFSLTTNELTAYDVGLLGATK
jgi:hypothetical protein